MLYPKLSKGKTLYIEFELTLRLLSFKFSHNTSDALLQVTPQCSLMNTTSISVIFSTTSTYILTELKGSSADGGQCTMCRIFTFSKPSYNLYFKVVIRVEPLQHSLFTLIYSSWGCTWRSRSLIWSCTKLKSLHTVCNHIHTIMKCDRDASLKPYLYRFS